MFLVAFPISSGRTSPGCPHFPTNLRWWLIRGVIRVGHRGCYVDLGVWRGSACRPMGVLFNVVVCWSLGFDARGSWSVGVIIVGVEIAGGDTSEFGVNSTRRLRVTYVHQVVIPRDSGGFRFPD
jgi:hypothetical protein